MDSFSQQILLTTVHELDTVLGTWKIALNNQENVFRFHEDQIDEVRDKESILTIVFYFYSPKISEKKANALK